ncbi:MAG: DUF429 domain-containing protein [Myxococcales bacterium]|nr:DUF429 domain-containing protein [Myxococcales bacterium]
MAEAGAWTVIGVHPATREARTGLAHASVFADGELTLRRVTLGTAGESAAATVAGWVRGQPRTVVAVHAPLGWPTGFARALGAHRAGEPIAAPAEQLFRRETDRIVQRELGRLPPDVGADRVARRARAALLLLAEVRQLLPEPLPMAWRPGQDAGVIEVWTDATLASRKIRSEERAAGSGRGREARARVLDRLQDEMVTAVSRDLLIDDSNLFEAAISALAAADFARGHGLVPEEPELAEREGWIFFRGSGQRTLF